MPSLAVRADDIKFNVQGLYEGTNDNGKWWPITLTSRNREQFRTVVGDHNIVDDWDALLGMYSAGQLNVAEI